MCGNLRHCSSDHLKSLPPGSSRPQPDLSGFLFREPAEEVLAGLRITVEDVARWQALGWTELSCAPGVSLDWGEADELRFLRDLSRRGLTEAQVNILLRDLPKPYRFTPERIAYSFTSGWLEVLPPLTCDAIEDAYRVVNLLAADGERSELEALREHIDEVLEELEDDDSDAAASSEGKGDRAASDSGGPLLFTETGDSPVGIALAPGWQSGFRNALCEFPGHYYSEFMELQPLVEDYLEGTPGTPSTRLLARELGRVLESWGAGKRKAPPPADCGRVAKALDQPAFRAAIGRLRALDLADLWLDSEGRGVIPAGLPIDTVFEDVILALRTAAEEVLSGANTIVLPSKVLLLLTGQFVALDVNVRSTLTALGVRGFNSTSLPVPATIASSHLRRYLALHFMLSHLWHRHADEFQAMLAGLADDDPRFTGLVRYPGRVFDMFLFTAGKGIRSPGAGRNWGMRILEHIQVIAAPGAGQELPE